GTHRYAADPSTEIQCVAFAVDDGPVQLWLPGNPLPPEFLYAALDPTWIVVAHNDSFETAIEQQVLAPQFGWPLIPIERHRCTMAMSLAAGLPARLSAAANALELANRKDAAGERLMHQTSKPRRARQDEDPAGTFWFDDPERLDRLYAYCRQDVEVQRELYTRLSPLPSDERAIWALSSTINERGFCVDRKFAEAARTIAQASACEDVSGLFWCGPALSRYSFDATPCPLYPQKRTFVHATDISANGQKQTFLVLGMSHSKKLPLRHRREL
ncbi:MAG: hypothetical protein WBX35_02195, partial [Pseudolabrys sp.]